MRSILMISVLFLSAACSAQIDWSLKDSFRGPVKAVKTSIFSAEGPIIIRVGERDSAANYNRVEIRVIMFRKDGKPIRHAWLTESSDTIAYCIWEYEKGSRNYKQTDYRKPNGIESSYEYFFYGDSLEYTRIRDGNGKVFSEWYKQTIRDAKELREYEMIEDKIDNNYLTITNLPYKPWKKYDIDSNGKRRLIQKASIMTATTLSLINTLASTQPENITLTANTPTTNRSR